MKRKVWLIGGTKDSVEIAKILKTKNISFITSVATLTAQALYSDDTEVFVGCMDSAKMQSFCQLKKIKTIVDASHPYAVEVSQNAIATAAELNIPYLRYERSNYQSIVPRCNSLITELDNFDLLLTGNYLKKERVLLTIGCKNLPLFKSWQRESILYARILPKIESLQIAISAGFTSDRLIAIRPPLSIDLERALWRQWDISLVITKASGKAGGEDIKHKVAADLNTPLIVITRPEITYPKQTPDLQDVLHFVTNR